MRRVLFLFVLLLMACASAATPTPAPVITPVTMPTAPPVATASAAVTPAAAATATVQATQPALSGSPEPPANAWWNDAVFYQIFVRSFYDGDGNGIGDFKGIITKLDYLTDLGVKGIWLMPIHPSTSYHGYDVTDYMAVNPDYGTMDDFKQLLDEAHQRGIRVIMDFVINHTSVEHPWFVASQDPTSDKRDWYIWSDTDPGYRGPWGEPVWHAGKSGYYYGVFWSGMPDLNYRNPAVTKQMEEVARFWLQDVGVDGFRLDGARHLIEEGQEQANTEATHAWFKQFYSFYKGVKPDALTIGEIWDSIFAAVPYVQNREMDMVFNFELASAYVSGASSGNGKRVRDAIGFNPGRYPPNQFGSFLTNHDMDRAMSQLGGDVGKMKSAAVMYLTGPGVPFIYYGEEIGMTGRKPDEYIRTPMQWSSEENAGFTTGMPWMEVNSTYEDWNVAAQADDPDSLLSLYRKLVTIRNEHAALREGDTYKVDASANEVYAALRVAGDEAVLVVVNLGDETLKDYQFDMTDSPLRGRYTLQTLLGEGETAPLAVSDRGGFNDYQPLAQLLPGEAVILALRRL